MNVSDIDTLKMDGLKRLAKELQISCKGTKAQLKESILSGRHGKYVVKEVLGDPGIDATTYAMHYNNNIYALKQYKKGTTMHKLLKDVELQNILKDTHICPDIIDINTAKKYIVMDKLDKHLVDTTKKKGISVKYQKQLIDIYKVMDEKGIFHGDPNPLNYMTKDNKLYVIDFGMSQKINKKFLKKMNTTQPNLHIMTFGFVLKLKAMDFPPDSYKILVKHLPDMYTDMLNNKPVITP